MLGRLRASRAVRTGLLIAALGSCLAGLIAEWPAVRMHMSGLHPYSVAAAVLAAAAGACCMAMAFRAVLADLGSRLPFSAAARILFVSQLAKYLPGSVWAFAAQVELGRDYQVPRRRCASAVVISMAITLAVALLTAAAAIPLASANAARHYWWVLAIAPLIMLGLCPPVLWRAVDRSLSLLRQPPLEQRPTARGVLSAGLWAAAGWLLWGLQAWLIVSGLTGRGSSVLGLAIGAYALAWSVGILVIVFPGGIGPRELALIAALAPVMPRAEALVVALVSRVVTTGSDVGCAVLGLAFGRTSRTGQRIAAASPDVPMGSRPGRGRQPGRHRKVAVELEPEPVLTTSLTA